MYTRKLLFFFLSLLAFLPAGAQQNADTVYVFRFVSHKDMFYIPWQENHTQLSSLLSLIETHKSAILSGEAPLLVDGYCVSEPTAVENLKLAKTRSNRVKSELILSKGVNESCFITHNHAEPYGDLRHVVIVRLRLPKAQPVVEKPYKEETPKQEPPAEPMPADTESGTPAARTESSASPASSASPESSASPASSRSCPLSLHANLLRWATLTPDLGVEWRINRRWSVLVGGSWTTWSWDDKNRRYALWKVSPELRYYLGKKGKGFVGAMYHAGQFNYKLTSTGRQGNYQGGGLTGGYRLPLNRSLSLDFHAAAGYTRADYDEYSLVDGIRVRQEAKSKNYWGINSVGISLIWLFNGK